MNVADRLRELREKAGIVNMAEAERRYSIYQIKYNELQEEIYKHYALPIKEGDILPEKLKDVELEDRYFGIRTMSALTLNILAIKKIVVFHPWGLTHKYPLWGLVQVYPLTAIFNEVWLGLVLPNMVADPILSQWVYVGKEQPTIKTITDVSHQFTSATAAIETLITDLIDDSVKPH